MADGAMDGTVDVRVEALLKCNARRMDSTIGVRVKALLKCRHGTVEVPRMPCEIAALLKCSKWHN